ncbi:hypothetical protein [Ensifer sp. LC54]|uniref:hypothetical protein n=1 Tax=Ensifer sp. LC54 TaxID=1873715 RepID=UPI0013798FA1|nr:hypothetical protein [Ensifer sp. LC54]
MLKPIKILTLVLVASTATACSVLTPSVKAKIELPALPIEVKDCDRPVLIPDRRIAQAETEKLWRRDRAALKACDDQNGILVEYYDDLRESLAATGK